MNIKMLIEVNELIAKCPVCTDETIGNGSELIIEENTFKRTCREYGWVITGEVNDNKIIITYDNRDELKKIRSTYKDDKYI